MAKSSKSDASREASRKAGTTRAKASHTSIGKAPTRKASGGSSRPADEKASPRKATASKKSALEKEPSSSLKKPASSSKKSASRKRKSKYIPVANPDPTTVELSAELDKLPRKKEDQPEENLHSIAHRTANLRNNGPFPVLRWVILVPLAALAYFFFFCLAGYSFSGLICLVLMGVILFYNISFLLNRKWPRGMNGIRRFFTVLLCIGVAIYSCTEWLIIDASLGDADEDIDYLVVLGAKVRSDGPSLSLQNRIDAAARYLTDHPEVIAVVTGGKGQDEPVTEASCMFDSLVRKGIDPQRIWQESEATSTWENLHYSLDLIEETTGQRPHKIGVLSSEYHLFRASLFARECGVDFVGVPAKTTKLSLKINYFLREVAGVWHYILLGGQYK